VTLDEDLIAAALGIPAPEEVVEADLVERRRRRVRRDVPADPLVALVGPGHHHGRVPPDDLTDLALDLLVTGEVGLLLGSDRVDVVGRDHRRQADLAGAGVK
jgi:hypothetical protein